MHSHPTLEIGESKKTQKYIPLTKYMESREEETPVNLDSNKSSNFGKPPLRAKQKEVEEPQVDSERVSFGKFMESIESQKDEVVREWMKRNNVDFLEDTSQFKQDTSQNNYSFFPQDHE